MRSLSRKKPTRHLFIGGTIILDLLAIALAFVIANVVRLVEPDWPQVVNIVSTIVPIYLAIALNNGSYQSMILSQFWRGVTRGTVAFLMAASAMLLILFFFKSSEEFSRLLFGIGTVTSVILLLGSRSLVFRLAKKKLGTSPYADLCIYDDFPCPDPDQSSVIVAADYGLTTNSNSIEAVNQLGQLVNGMDRVVVYCSENRRPAWVFMLRSLDIASEIVVPELDSISPLAIRKRNTHTSLLISSGQLRWDQKLTKRLFDLAVAIFAIIALSPVLLVTAIIIRLESPGPALFRQDRIGLGNRKFRILKFRSMRSDMQDNAAAKLTERDDPRITSFGRFIRAKSIDELPQLFNVLSGDMSIVGPRPHAEKALAGSSLYWEVDNSYWHRHVVKPGITGLAQVRGHRGTTFLEEHLQDRLNSDLEYAAQWSLLQDIRILLKTLTVLFHKNAF